MTASTLTITTIELLMVQSQNEFCVDFTVSQKKETYDAKVMAQNVDPYISL